MVGIEGLDVGGGCLGPGVDDGGGAAVAAGLVGQLPGEDGGRALVARHDGGDVFLVLGLGGAVGVPGLLGAAESGHVGGDTAVVGPVVYLQIARLECGGEGVGVFIRS